HRPLRRRQAAAEHRRLRRVTLAERPSISPCGGCPKGPVDGAIAKGCLATQCLYEVLDRDVAQLQRAAKGLAWDLFLSKHNHGHILRPVEPRAPHGVVTAAGRRHINEVEAPKRGHSLPTGDQWNARRPRALPAGSCDARRPAHAARGTGSTTGFVSSAGATAACVSGTRGRLR